MNDVAPPGSINAGQAQSPPHSRLRRWLGLLCGVPTPIIFLAAALLATFVLWRQGALGEVGSSLREVAPWKAIVILLAYTMSVLVLGLRWHVLARIAGGAPDWTTSAQVFLTSVIVNYAAPIGLAVPTRAALTVRDLGLTPGQSAAVVGWEVFLDVVALLLISAAWLFLGGSELLLSIALEQNLLVAAVAIALLAGVLAALVVWAESLRSRLTRLVRPMLSSPTQHPGLAVTAMALTVFFWGTQTGIMAALLAVFGTPPTPPLVLGVMGLPVLIGMLSPVPGGAGVREALMAAAARLEGAPAGPVVLAAITYRLTLFVVTPIAWGAVRVARGALKRR